MQEAKSAYSSSETRPPRVKRETHGAIVTFPLLCAPLSGTQSTIVTAKKSLFAGSLLVFVRLPADCDCERREGVFSTAAERRARYPIGLGRGRRAGSALPAECRQTTRGGKSARKDRIGAHVMCLKKSFYPSHHQHFTLTNNWQGLITKQYLTKASLFECITSLNRACSYVSSRSRLRLSPTSLENSVTR